MTQGLLNSLAILLLTATAATAADVSGKWSGSFSGGPIYLILKQEGNRLSGSGGPNEGQQVLKFDNGKVEDDRLIFQAGPFHFDLRVSGNDLRGEVKNGDETLALSLSRAGTAQPETAPRKFDVASVKPNKSGNGGINGRGGAIRVSKGQVSLEDVSLWKCIGFAYAVGEDKDYAISGPAWLKSERYDIIAKIPPDTRPDQLPLMLRSLLAERFKLTLHRESKEMPVYGLVVAKSGSKLHEVEFGKGGFSIGRGRIQGQKAALGALADRLSQALDRPVLDMTGLAGVFDFTLEWAPDEGDAPTPATAGASIFTAIQQQLGLKLDARRAPVQILVVDRADKVPVEN